MINVTYPSEQNRYSLSHWALIREMSPSFCPSCTIRPCVRLSLPSWNNQSCLLSKEKRSAWLVFGRFMCKISPRGWGLLRMVGSSDGVHINSRSYGKPGSRESSKARFRFLEASLLGELREPHTRPHYLLMFLHFPLMPSGDKAWPKLGDKGLDLWKTFKLISKPWQAATEPSRGEGSMPSPPIAPETECSSQIKASQSRNHYRIHTNPPLNEKKSMATVIWPYPTIPFNHCQVQPSVRFIYPSLPSLTILCPRAGRNCRVAQVSWE